MRLVTLSDTHGFHRGMTSNGQSVPVGDVFVFNGDFSRDYGSWTDTLRMIDWMGKLPHQHKVLCAGNHDVAVFQQFDEAARLFQDRGVHLLGKAPVTLDGVVFDGAPAMPVSGWNPPWGFETPDNERQKQWERIGPCDVLVTHTPPLGVLDKTDEGKHIGDPLLRTAVFGTIRPKVHCFGHVHEGRGTFVQEGTTFINAASNTRGTFVRDEVNGVTHMTVSIRDAIVFDLET